MPHSCTVQINLYGHACCNITFNDKQFSTCILVIYFCSVWCRGGTGSLGREAWYLNICPGTYLSFHSWGRGGNWSFTSSTPSLSVMSDNWLVVVLLVSGIFTIWSSSRDKQGVNHGVNGYWCSRDSPYQSHMTQPWDLSVAHSLYWEVLINVEV